MGIPLLEKVNSKGEKSVRVEDDGTRMRIHDSRMKEFFKPAVDGITNLIKSYLGENKIASTIDTIYWVGGFGGCKYLHNELEVFIKQKKKLKSLIRNLWVNHRLWPQGISNRWNGIWNGTVEWKMEWNGEYT